MSVAQGQLHFEVEALSVGAGAFGRHLLQEREFRGLSRDEISKLTKLPPVIIEALESGVPERMPPQAYVVGYLRSYAGAVGLDADDIVLRWQEVVGHEQKPSRRVRPPVLGAAVAAVVVLALAALAALTLIGPHEPRHAPAHHPVAASSDSADQDR
jgi:cytoskeletal protein RodZ